MLILVLKRPKNDFLNSVRILVQKTKKTRFYRKFCHFLKIHEKSRFLGQILEIFAVFLAFFNEKVVSARQRTVEISIFWKKFPVPGSPVQGIAQRPCSLYRDSLNARVPSTGIRQKGQKSPKTIGKCM